MNKKDQIWDFVKLLAGPGLLCLSGLVLLISPDTASALVGKLLGWVLMLAGIGFAAAAFTRRENRVFSVVMALILLGLGGRLLRNPLALASGLGRVLGVLLLIQGGRDLLGSVTRGGRALAGITAALGLILLLMPMTTSRLVFTGLGAVLLVTGVTEGVSRIRQRRLEDGGGSIIDAL